MSREPFFDPRTPADPTHRELLRQGFERSATFRNLIAEIEASSWLVFVQTGRCPEKLTVACLLHFVGTFDGKPSFVSSLVMSSDTRTTSSLSSHMNCSTHVKSFKAVGVSTERSTSPVHAHRTR